MLELDSGDPWILTCQRSLDFNEQIMVKVFEKESDVI